MDVRASRDMYKALGRSNIAPGITGAAPPM